MVGPMGGGGDSALGNAPPPSCDVDTSIFAFAEFGRPDIISALLETLLPREWCLLTTPTAGMLPVDAPAPVSTGGTGEKLCGASGWSPEGGGGGAIIYNVGAIIAYCTTCTGVSK